MRQSYQQSGPADLLELLNAFSSAQCSLARDHIYALLGIAKGGSDNKHEIDYYSSLESIVQKYAALFVREGAVKDLVLRAGLGSQASRFPSWVPDWFSGDNQKDFEVWDEGYMATGSSLVSERLTSNLDELILSGCRIDSIITTSSTITSAEMCEERYFVLLERILHQQFRYQFCHELLARFALGNPVKPGMLSREPGTLLHQSDIYPHYLVLRHRNNLAGMAGITKADRERVEQLDVVNRDRMAMLYKRNAEQFHNHIGRGGEQGRFCITERGFARLVRNVVEHGDEIALFAGFHVPFIVRKSAQKEGAYRLVGQAYIHGIMRGDVWDEKEQDCKIDGERIQLQNILLH
jgi:hypothetical protein